MSEYILEMKEITKAFSGVKALDKVSFSVRPGEIHALVGENGAGKSTLMKVLSGVYIRDEGKLIFDGGEMFFNNIAESEAAGISIVHQELNIIKNLTVCENIFLGNELRKKGGVIDWDEENRISKEVLSTLSMDISPNTPVAGLSMGQQQMIEIARAINKKSRLIIFDEPTSSLTEKETEILMGILQSLRASGVSIIYISHKLPEIFRLADTVTVLRDGKTIVSKPIGELTENDLIAYMVGRELTTIYPESTHKSGDVIFEMEAWSANHPTIPGRKILDNISINARKGEILGIVGLMGAGRTELALSIFGAGYKNCAGRLKLNGKEVKIRSPKAAIDNGVAYVTEDRKKFGLVLGNTIKDNVALPNLRRFARLSVIDNNSEIKEVKRYSDDLRVKATSIMQIAKTLSGGNQQKVILAKWLMSNPDVLIVDEPTRGIDVGAKYEIYTILDNLAAKGKCIIMISSEMPEIIGMCDRVYVMNEGKIVGELEDGDISQVSIMQCIQGGRK